MLIELDGISNKENYNLCQQATDGGAGQKLDKFLGFLQF